ncbi:hypothetical protein ANO11243_080970 [Dothideomycetidae sp. 11243]|nr:hypothetical protein ANO11243_080970 [fungal sp. No.11243]
MANMGANAALGLTVPTKEMLEATSPDQARRLSMDPHHPAGVAQRKYGFEGRVNPDVTYEEYRYWAKVERRLEQEDNQRYIEDSGPTTMLSVFKGRFSKGVHHDRAKRANGANNGIDNGNSPSYEKDTTGAVTAVGPGSLERGAIDAEWRNASRALRTASWGTVFFILTTDILGWSGAPFVFASVGYGMGVGIYIIFGIAAFFAGWSIWRCFLALDSSLYPMLSFGDPFYRLIGPKVRHAINVMQSLQQFLTVAVLILASGQIIAQLANNKICFIACMIIVMAVGMIAGLIRSLQRLGWLCNASVWLNIVSFIIICVAAAKYGPDYSVINASTLIKTTGNITKFAGPPPADYQQQSTNLFSAQFNGVDTMVYAYSGALLFVAFLAEMRHPMDFWKGLIIGQGFICAVYIFFGAFVYSFFGQYSASNISQVINPNSLRVVSNVLALLTGMIAVFLYFNVGMKTVYLEVGQEVLHLPPITTARGKIMWYILGPIYWIIAFIVAAAVPNLNGIVNFVGGLFSLNFTYSLPGMMYLAFKIQEGATLPGEGFDPATGITTRHDQGMKRVIRGFRNNLIICLPTLIYVCAGLAASGMGTWAAIEGLIAIFGPGGTVATSFGCAQPV